MIVDDGGFSVSAFLFFFFFVICWQTKSFAAKNPPTTTQRGTTKNYTIFVWMYPFKMKTIKLKYNATFA